MGDIHARLDAHRRLREGQLQLLELRRRHNELEAVPPWDLASDAQMLVQQTMIEADLLSAVGRRDDVNALRRWPEVVDGSRRAYEPAGSGHRRHAPELPLAFAS